MLDTKRINPLQPKYHKTNSPEAFLYGAATLRGDQITKYTDCLWRMASTVARAEGHAEGYAEGYEAGQEDGLNEKYKPLSR